MNNNFISRVKPTSFVIAVWIMVVMLLAISSCNSPQFVMDDTSMEGTIKKGQTFEVLPAEEILSNQIIAFTYNDEYYGEKTTVSRVVGVPGDTIKVVQGQLFVNGDPFPEPEKVKYQYQVILDGKLGQETIKDMEYQQLNSQEYVFFLTRKEADILRYNPAVTTLRILVRDWGIARPELFGADTANKWNLDYYGPLLVPKKGEYGATEDLYFVMSDNRHNAVDSRFIGYIPASSILGVIKFK